MGQCCSFENRLLYRTLAHDLCFWSRRAGEPGVSLAIERGGNGDRGGGRLGFWGAKEKKKGGAADADGRTGSPSSAPLSFSSQMTDRKTNSPSTFQDRSLK